MIDIESLLKDCCAVETFRYEIDKPWKDGTTTYATDGRICVRTRHTTSAQPPENTPPPVNEMLWDAVYSDTPLVMPKRFEPQPKLVGCRHCNGDGVLDCDMDYEHQCDECEGTGKTEPQWRCFDFGCLGLSEKYLAIVIRHGGKVYPRVDNPSNYVVRVVFDDKTDAVLMPAIRDRYTTLVPVPQEAP
jgi:hypothetical protein